MKKRKSYYNFILSLILILCLVTGCGAAGASTEPETTESETVTSDTSDDVRDAEEVPSDESDDSEDSENSDAEEATDEEEAEVEDEAPEEVDDGKGTRDNTIQVLTPTADGAEVYSGSVASIDCSHTDQGYFMAQYYGSNWDAKLGVIDPNYEVTYYDLNSSYEAFPLTSGNGTYIIKVYENIEADYYSEAFSQSISVNITNPYGPYLYPNQYVWFTAGTDTVQKAAELAYPANTDLEVVENVYNYIITNVTYDYNKAATVQDGYLPNVDDTLHTNTGICFDYAVLMIAMLRSQRIPARLEIGYMGSEYHAWLSVHTEEQGWINGIIQFDGSTWKMMDPTFAASSGNPVSFTPSTGSYQTMYIY